MEKTGDSANNTVTFSSGDATNPTGWADIGVVASGEKHSSLMRKFSLAVKNLRYLWKLLGGTSLAGIGDGTVTGAINALNTGLDGMLSPIVIAFKDYDIRPTVSNSVVDLNYDISDLILPGYIISQIVDVKVLYTDSHRYQQVTITNLSSQSATAKIMCLNTVPFKIRIYALIYRKSAIAN